MPRIYPHLTQRALRDLIVLPYSGGSFRVRRRMRKRLCDLGGKRLAWSIHHASAVLRNEPHMLYPIAQMRMGEQNRG